MKKRKIEIKIGLAIVWAVCFLFGMGYRNLIGVGIWPMTLTLVGIGIFASVIFLKKETMKESRGIIWLGCVAFCTVVFIATGIGACFAASYKIGQIQVSAENAMEEYGESQGKSYIRNTKGVIRTDDAYVRFGIWKTEEGEFALLLVEITEEDIIGPVREVPLPISKKELSGTAREKAGKPTQGSTIASYGGPDLFSIKKQRPGL